MVIPLNIRASDSQAVNIHADCAVITPRAFRIAEVCSVTGIGRTMIYAAIKAGHLVARKYGRCTIILAEDLNAWLASLPPKV